MADTVVSYTTVCITIIYNSIHNDNIKFQKLKANLTLKPTNKATEVKTSSISFKIFNYIYINKVIIILLKITTNDFSLSLDLHYED